MKVEILAKPSEPTGHLERLVQNAASSMKIQVQVFKTNNFSAYSHLAINPTLTPIIIINGSVEFAGKPPEFEVLKKRFAEIIRRQ